MTSPAESHNQSNPESLPDARPSGQVRIPWFTRAFASGLYTGYSPVASGTAGSALGLGFYLIPGFEQPWIIITLCFLVFVLGAKAAGILERRYGHDPAEVTIDEVLGMWISLLFLPKSLLTAIAAFFIFRIMDIVKPFPARKFDSLTGGFGIMADDVVAGFYTNAVMHILVRLGVFESLPF